MRMWSKPVLVLVAVAAGVSLAGCNSHSSTHHSHKGRKSRSISHSGSGYGKGSAATHRPTAQPATATSGGRCRSTQLAASAHPGFVAGEVVVVLRNTGSRACTMYGFPGVDLTGKDGRVSAKRSSQVPSSVRVVPGGSASFSLHYTPNTSGGSGAAFTGLSVTPPDDTRQLSVPLSLSLPAGDTGGDPVTVDPVRSAA
jgi:hypothetical protein